MLPKFLSRSFLSQPSKSTMACKRFPKLAAILYKSVAHSPIFSTVHISSPTKFYSSAVKTNFEIRRRILFSPLVDPSLKLRFAPSRQERTICFFKNRSDGESLGKYTEGSNWRLLRRWDVPWNWQTISLTSLACPMGYVSTGLIVLQTRSLIKFEELSLDVKAEIFFAEQTFATVVALGVLYRHTNLCYSLPDDIYRYDFREPFNLKKGWLLWAGIGLGAAVAAYYLTVKAMLIFSGEMSELKTDASPTSSLPSISSSSISTACLVGLTTVLAPILEETVFRGFLMVALTKWLPTPVSVLISAAVFAGAHMSLGTFPQTFVLGTVLGFSYAQTRNLLTPITIHALWNSGVAFFGIKKQEFSSKKTISRN